MTERSAKSVCGMPWGNQGKDGFSASVGRHFNYFDKTTPVVTAITLTDDLPGLHCNMERVRVWAGEQLLWEGPLHNLEGVKYV